MSASRPDPVPLDSLVDVQVRFLPPWYVDEALSSGHEVPDGMSLWAGLDDESVPWRALTSATSERLVGPHPAPRNGESSV